MKRIISLLLILLTLAANAAQARVGARVGGQISSKTTLIGANVSGMELNRNTHFPGSIGVDYADVTVKELADLRAHNIMNLRLPFASDRMQQSYLGSLDATYTAQMDTIVSRAAFNGQKIVWDNHQFGVMLNHTLNDGTLTTLAVADFCTKFATHYLGSSTVVGFEIQNEPNGFGLSNWVSYAQTCITAYRAVDANMPIYVDGYGFASEYQWLSNGNDVLRSLTGGHIIFVGHAYGDWINSGTYPVYGSSLCCSASPSNTACTPGASSYSCAVTMGDQLDSPPTVLNTNILVKRASTYYVPWCEQYGLSCVTNEQGVPNDDPNWLTALDNSITYHQLHNIPFYYWSAGEFFSTYALGLQNQTSGIDNVQWAVLNKYTNAYPNAAYQLTGPLRGTAGNPSSNFTASFRGVLARDTVVTPSSNGSGGTFTPSSFTFPANAFNPSGSFTFSSSGSQTYKISTTNSFAKTNPATLGYATIADQFLNANASTVNCYSMMKIYAPYIGPLVNLRDTTTGLTKDFYPVSSLVLNSPLDTAAVASWLGGHTANTAIWYDQCPTGNHLYSLYDKDVSQDGGGTSTADEPLFVASCQNSLPCLNFTGGGRMNAVSPINNNTAQTVLGVFAPDTHFNNGTTLIGWDWNTIVNQDPFEVDLAHYTGSPTIRLYSSDATFSAIGVTWSQNVSHTGIKGFRDQVKMSQDTSGAAALSLPFSRKNLNVGYERFFGNGYHGKIGELLAFTNDISSYVPTFQADEDSRWGITAYPSFSYNAPTLNQNTSGAANTYPWLGYNSSGLDFGFPLYPDSVNAPSYFANKGANFVRFPMKWFYVQPTLSGALDPTVIGKVVTDIAAWNALGLDVLIDIHSSCSWNGQLVGATPGPTNADVQDFWTRMMNTAGIGNNPKVQIDLFNEPSCSDANLLVTDQGSINAIRAAESVAHYIHYEDHSYQCQHVADTAGPNFLTLTDGGQNKLILHCHAYWDSNNSGGSDIGSNGSGTSRLSAAITYVQAHNIPLFIGEFGIGFTPSEYTETKAALDLTAANFYVPGNGGIIGWTAWGGGPAWTESYFFLLEPRHLADNVVDRPQMRILNTYWTGHTWKCKGGGNGTAGICPGTWPDGQFP